MWHGLGEIHTDQGRNFESELFNSLHSSMVVCIHPIVLYCLHPRGKTVVFFFNKVHEKNTCL